MKKSEVESYSSKNHLREEAYLRAEKRVKELKGFYWHLFWYIIVNLFLIFIISTNTNEGFWSFGTFSTAFFWGIGLFFHAVSVFFKWDLFSKKWQERKIKEYMDKDKRRWE